MNVQTLVYVFIHFVTTILVIRLWELYNFLLHIQFATSKTKLDIYYNKLGVKVAERVAERLKAWDLKFE